MSRAPRWWRPAPQRNVRPAVRSARRTRPATVQDAAELYDAGHQAGRDEEAQRSENRDRQIRRLMDAIHAADQGDPSLLDELGREAGAGDDLLDVADAAGATPLADAGFEDELVGEIEAWLRGQDGGR